MQFYSLFSCERLCFDRRERAPPDTCCAILEPNLFVGFSDWHDYCGGNLDLTILRVLAFFFGLDLLVRSFDLETFKSSLFY